MPLLIALGANVVLMSQHGHREMALEQLYTGYRQNVMAPDEVLAWIKVPLPEPAEFLRVYKISKRFEDDISAVCLAISLHREDGRIRRVLIGAGGVAATPARARQTEACLLGRAPDSATFEAAAQVLQTEFQPITDMRASAAYRRELLGNLVRRFGLEIQGQTNTSIDTLVLEDLA